MKKWERYAYEMASANSSAVWLVVALDGWRAVTSPKDMDHGAPEPHPTAKEALDALYAKLLSSATRAKDAASQDLDRTYERLTELADIVEKI